LWRSMARIQCRVARGHNRRRRVLGRLWQSRYKARVVRDDSYFKQLLAYVHLNPVAAGLVEDPAAYPWSGHAALIGKRSSLLVDAHAALRGFGDTTVTAREAYLEQVRMVAEARWLDSGVRTLPWWEDVSNDDQIIELKDADNAVDYRGEAVPFSSNGGIGLNQAATFVCRGAGITVDVLRGRSRSPEIAAARKAFAVLAVNQLGHSVADVAMMLQKHPGSVSRWLETPRGIDDSTELASGILKLKPYLDAEPTGM
jgi:putative transposase